MMQTAKPWHGYDFATCAGIVFCLTTGRRSFRQGKMRSVVVIITDVIIHKAFQMALVEHDHMVEKVAAAVPNPALGDAVLPPTSKTGALGLYAKVLHSIDHLRIEAGTAIKDQVYGSEVISEQKSDLTSLLITVFPP